MDIENSFLIPFAHLREEDLSQLHQEANIVARTCFSEEEHAAGCKTGWQRFFI
jgi:hypothetical protein